MHHITKAAAVATKHEVHGQEAASKLLDTIVGAYGLATSFQI